MQTSEAIQIAELLNNRNRLTRNYTTRMVLRDASNYFFRKVCGNVVACVEVKKVQWYQSEVCHLTVHQQYGRQGHGRALIQQAINAAIDQGSRILQCTIREDNEASERLFIAEGFLKTCSFHNIRSGNNVHIYQKSLIVGT